ncbi:MAG: transketolase C-terminal domain-containing protein [Gammaproteobacteria bacterium]
MVAKAGGYAILEAIQFEMRAQPHMTMLYQGTKPVAVSALGQIIDLQTEFGDVRLPEGPIDEEWYVGGAAGIAMTGVPVIAHLPFMCTLRSFELVFNQVGKLRHMTGGQVNMPLVIWQDGAGRLLGLAGQHADAGQEALYAGIPGIKVVVPSNPYDAKGLMTAAIRDPDPVIFFHYGAINSISIDVPDDDYIVPIGEAAIRQEGSDITIVGFGNAAIEINRAMDGLKAENISAEIIDPRTLKPLPIDAIAASVRKTGKLLVVDHGQESMGTSAEIISRVAIAVPGARLNRSTFPDAPPPGEAGMISWMTPDAAKVVLAAKQMMRAA